MVVLSQPRSHSALASRTLIGLVSWAVRLAMATGPAWRAGEKDRYQEDTQVEEVLSMLVLVAVAAGNPSPVASVEQPAAVVEV